MMDPLDQLRQTLSEPIAQVAVGEQRASLHTDPSNGWILMLQKDRNDWNVTRIRQPEPCNFAFIHNQDWRFLASHMPDDAKSVEIAGSESAASTSGRGLRLAVLPLLDAATARFLDEDRNVVCECAIAPYLPPKKSPLSALSKLNPFIMPRGKHTFRSR